MGYTKASIEDAEQHYRDTTVRDENGELYSICKTRSRMLGNYGVGICMYFYFIKMAAIGFAVITVLSIPAFYAYYNGGYLAQEETTSALDLTTLANL